MFRFKFRFVPRFSRLSRLSVCVCVCVLRDLLCMLFFFLLSLRFNYVYLLLLLLYMRTKLNLIPLPFSFLFVCFFVCMCLFESKEEKKLSSFVYISFIFFCLVFSWIVVSSHDKMFMGTGFNYVSWATTCALNNWSADITLYQKNKFKRMTKNWRIKNHVHDTQTFDVIKSWPSTLNLQRYVHDRSRCSIINNNETFHTTCRILLD